MHSTRSLLLSTLSLVVAGCAAGGGPSVVPDADNGTYIPALRMSCAWPYKLDRDCSATAGPLEKLATPDVRASLAGSEDGTVIVVFGDKERESTEPELASNRAYRHIKKKLTRNRVRIVRVVPIMAVGTVLGYAIETNKAAYHLLTASGNR